MIQESNLAARQPQGTTSIIQAITGEGLAQGPYVVARTNDLPHRKHRPGTWTKGKIPFKSANSLANLKNTSSMQK